jgi:hypothetical protein
MMKMFFAVAASVMAVSAACSSAAVAQSAQPYSGMENRPIKALSDQQVSDLKAGRGMGLALAAELNGYPGPSHLVELSDQLGLTPDQLSKLKGMFDAMKADTIPIGERLVALEAELDQLFAENLISEQAHLRDAHLRYHLQARAILHLSQIRRYAELRGYGADLQEPAHHHHN